LEPTSRSGGISKSIAGVAIGCESLQIFTHNPRTCGPINHTDAEIAPPRGGRRRRIGPIVSHGLYLMNLGAPTGTCRRDAGKPATSTEHLSPLGDESHPALEIGERLGLRASSPRRMSKAARLRNPSAGSRPGSPSLCGGAGSCQIYLENTAGRATPSGGRSASSRMSGPVGNPKRLGVCLDTQHLFASGYPIHEPGGSTPSCGLRCHPRYDQLRCLHLNDSMTDFGSNPDRTRTSRRQDRSRRHAVDSRRTALQDLPVILEVPASMGRGPTWRT